MPRPKPFIKPSKPDPVDLGWLAGFFEGEGCFSAYAGRPIATANQGDKSVLVRFRRLVGVGKVYRLNKKVNRQMWVWKTNSIAEAHYVAELLYPLLSRHRQAQARKILALKPQRAHLAEGSQCINGHALTSDNIIIDRRHNSMACRLCTNKRRRRRYAQRRRSTSHSK
jgi:hypothetical protein